MRLPQADAAIIDERKIREYLLSAEHPIGRFKAAFFRSVGYGAAEANLLREALLAHAREGEAELGEASAYGQRYRVRGILRGPTGRSASLVTVWIVPSVGEAPRLVTAFPGDR